MCPARTGQVYVQIAEHWDAIAQRAAPSIRAALAAIQGAPRARVERYTLTLENVGSPEELARVLASVRGRSVSLKVRVQQHASAADERQLMLPLSAD